ncbi:class II myosin [Elasticomyces elasticus]|uniref:Class II myosin n=1 Tax=Exophiala sideris TaxID=1016849 RepID=A0ABR0JLL8_9EURO|nr:class II myosin [Elasticomyces elasticus]KAK5036463.1 class II myosin [Exophiala sideris]KAK5041708.1 class II myosin [Exophiala sideris]KAK5066846.1 class II myosin [Exophiala sideris]KAK5184905.1 class II myosin [Eurotiomycetes sp. CCFEE 6388]
MSLATPISPANFSKSLLFASPSSAPPSRHERQQSYSPSTSFSSIPHHVRTQSLQRQSSTSSTFAPKFIKSEEMRKSEDRISAIEGENDFSGKRYVWIKDPEKAFVRGWIVEDVSAKKVLVQFDDGSQIETDVDEVDKVNPAKFDKADDMAELTHLNEASVIHNLHTRYQADLIYTYSGLFLVTINPYCPLPIYGNDYIRMYKGQAREDTRPHIFAVSDAAFRRLVEEGENQSILVTGESGAGKTENTKKVIQYLAAVATSDLDTPLTGRTPGKQLSNLSQQILRANPILESFGNAQTVRNNNSSRFGKFIRIQFTRSGQIAGAFIDWYLLEKSRVVRVSQQERSYHIFYQLLAGADQRMRDALLISGMDVEHFAYTRAGNDTISGVSDRDEWNTLIEAFHIMNFSEKEQEAVFRTVAAILHLGNVAVRQESRAGDQASLTPEARASVDKACQLLGVQTEPFIKGLLHPKVKAGREWVEKVQTPEQVRLALDALAKGIYERGFGDLVNKINTQLDRGGVSSDDSHFIGVLDIAGFEIFETNSFEQLCINYTNEKLQQFFNHYMFVLEQEEYAREQIEWQFIDFGKDLQPTIDLIELPNPIGIFSCLDEDSVMPKATDKSFTDKLHSLWEKKTPKYSPARTRQGFLLTHYAAEVEYSTEGWLEKNKDPLNDNLTRLLAASKDDHIANLFSDCVEEVDEPYSPRSRVKKGLFRTVAQRHKEQLSSLMRQLHSTQPHFVRCILPNHKKKPKQFNAPLVLDQLRCNGVLEGIRIARTGFPNRLTFAEFRSRYEVLCENMPKGYLGGQEAAKIMLDRLKMDRANYRVGITKVFFRAGVLADLEEQRDGLIREIMSNFQSVARGFMQRRMAFKQLYRAEATRVIQRNLNVYLDLQADPWWRLFVRMKPLLGATRTNNEVKRRDEKIEQLHSKMKQDANERHRLEDERRRAELDAQRIQQTLESERALALDKEEIFKRLQYRESELTEKLSEAIAEQETLEDQLDAALDSKKKTDEELTTRREQVLQAGQIITRLEAEKKELQRQVENLEGELENVEKTHSRNDDRLENISQELRTLKSQLGAKDKKISELETSLLHAERDKSQLGAKDRKISELEMSLQQFQHVEREKETKAANLEQELRSLRSQLSQRDRSTEDLEKKLQRAESLRLEENKRKTEDYESQIRALRSELSGKDRKMQDLESTLSKIDQDAEAKLASSVDQLTNAKKLLRELQGQNDELRQQITSMSTESSKHEGALRRKEGELSALMADMQKHEREKSALQKEIDGLSGRHDSMAVKHRKLQDDVESMRAQKTKMEREAAEVMRHFEQRVMPFFKQNFS